MKKIIQKLIGVLTSLDDNTQEVAKKSMYSVLVKLLGLGFLFLTSVFLGRSLGSEGLGIINLADRIVVILSILCLFGMPQLIIKKSAIAFSLRSWDDISKDMRSSKAYVFAFSTLFAVVFLILAKPLSNKVFAEPDLLIPLSILLVAMVAQTRTRIFTSFLIGFRKIWQSNLLNETLSVILSGLTLLVFYVLQLEITLIVVAIIYATARFLTLFVARTYWRTVFKHKTGKSNKISASLLKASAPFLMINATAIIMSNVDIVMLGWLTDAEKVGLYSVASKLALLTIFFLQVSNTAISPKIASLYAEDKISDINLMVQKTTLALIFGGVITISIFYFFGMEILGAWGKDFYDSYDLLIVLSIGQFFNVSTGCAGYVLTMCGFEKLLSRIIVFYMILNIVLNYVLITTIGVLGAAIATAVTIALENLTKVIFAYRKTKINTIPIRIFLKDKHGK